MADWTNDFITSPTHSFLARIAAESLVVGGNGVDLFFALSAYLITELLLRERRTYNTIDVQSFYIRRALRIWPLYYGALLLMLICSGLLPELADLRSHLLWYFLFAGNFARGLWGAPELLAPLWSVSVEEQFYFLWPLAIRRLSRRWIVLLAIALWAIGIIFRVFMQGTPDSEFAFNTFARLDPIAAGILLAAFLNGRVDIKCGVTPAIFAIAGVIFCGLGFLAVISSMWELPRMLYLPAFAESMVALASLAFLVAAIGSGSGGFLSARPLVYLGRISYGLYVFHAAVIMIGRAMFGFPEGILRWCLMATELAATVAIAAASYRWWEEPFLRLKRRFQRVSSGGSLERQRAADLGGAA